MSHFDATRERIRYLCEKMGGEAVLGCRMFGRPIDEFSRDELLVIVAWATEQLTARENELLGFQRPGDL